jgi:RNA polymerase sigma factor (sigma-70 family)
MAKKIISNDEFTQSYTDNYHQILIKFICNKYRYKLNRDDLESCGMLGMWKALRNYDATRGYKFTTLLTKCVDMECKRELVKQNRSYKFMNGMDQKPKKYIFNIDKILFAINDKSKDLEQYENREFISHLVKHLEPNEIKLLNAKYFYKQTFREIAKSEKVSRQRVEQRLQLILDKLKGIAQKAL